MQTWFWFISSLCRSVRPLQGEVIGAIGFKCLMKPFLVGMVFLCIKSDICGCFALVWRKRYQVRKCYWGGLMSVKDSMVIGEVCLINRQINPNLPSPWPCEGPMRLDTRLIDFSSWEWRGGGRDDSPPQLWIPKIKPCHNCQHFSFLIELLKDFWAGSLLKIIIYKKIINGS